MNYALFKRTTYGILIRLGGFCTTIFDTQSRVIELEVTHFRLAGEVNNQKKSLLDLPASFRSRIRFQSDSAFRTFQFSILAEKLRKNLYSRKLDILRCIFCSPPCDDEGGTFPHRKRWWTGGGGGDVTQSEQMYRRRLCDDAMMEGR